MFAAQSLALVYEERRRTEAVHMELLPGAVACFCLFENGTQEALCDGFLFPAQKRTVKQNNGMT
jgi:hypothetical protein